MQKNQGIFIHTIHQKKPEKQQNVLSLLHFVEIVFFRFLLSYMNMQKHEQPKDFFNFFLFF